MELAKLEFKRPPLLEDDEIESILGKIDDLISWASDIKDYALQAAIGGKRWFGWKLVEGKSNRKYVNEDVVAQTVRSAGYDPYERQGDGNHRNGKGSRQNKIRVKLLDGLVEKPARQTNARAGGGQTSGNQYCQK